MSKKLNRIEIATLAKRILEEVNEVNQKYNNTVKASPTYIAEIERINAQDPLKAIKDQFIKELKIKFGTKYDEEVRFELNSYSSSNVRKEEESILNEIKKYNDSQLKKVIKYNNRGNEYRDSIEKIIDDITIAQIDITDVQLLINTIKSKLL